jgi:hypothetical protein
MNCAECKDLLVAYVEALLDESQKQAVAKHLSDCRSCRAEVKELTALRDRLVKNGQVLAQSDLENHVLERIIREQNVRLKTAIKISTGLKIRRIIMKSPIIKIAAAAAIIIAVLIGINPFGGTVTFADVIEPILNARTVVLDFIVGDETDGPVMQDVVVGSKIRRTFSNMETILILDLDNAKMLTLSPADKGAIYMDIQGPLQEGTKSYLGLVRDIVSKIEDNPNIPVQELGEREIDGQRAVGFLLIEPNIKLTIWADLETALPIRIEFLQGQTQTIIKNIEFDVLVDESLVSMDVPAGYTLHEKELDWSEFNEQDFIVVLQLWAEHVLGGKFPDSVTLEDLMKLAPVLGEKIGQLNISDEEKTQLGMAMGRGFVFFQQLEPNGIDWHYVGKGVELGDANTAVFLYRPKGSDTYRVICGDLSVKDSAPEDLPK